MLMDALYPEADIGCVLETFFLNQLRSAGYSTLYPKQGGFLINNHDLLEVSGKGKTFAQIKGFT